VEIVTSKITRDAIGCYSITQQYDKWED